MYRFDKSRLAKLPPDYKTKAAPQPPRRSAAQQQSVSFPRLTVVSFPPSSSPNSQLSVDRLVARRACVPPPSTYLDPRANERSKKSKRLYLYNITLTNRYPPKCIYVGYYYQPPNNLKSVKCKVRLKNCYCWQESCQLSQGTIQK